MTIFNFWVMLSNFDLLQMFYVLNTSSPVLATKISRPQQYAFSVRNTELILQNLNGMIKIWNTCINRELRILATLHICKTLIFFSIWRRISVFVKVSKTSVAEFPVRNSKKFIKIYYFVTKI